MCVYEYVCVCVSSPHLRMTKTEGRSYTDDGRKGKREEGRRRGYDDCHDNIMGEP